MSPYGVTRPQWGNEGILQTVLLNPFISGGAGGINFDELPIQDMVLNALKNNPKITYSPNGTDADLIIDQVGYLMRVTHHDNYIATSLPENYHFIQVILHWLDSN